MRRVLAAAIGLLVTLGALAAPAGAASTSPAYPHDFPDPSVLPVGNPPVYYAYSTGSGYLNLQEMQSTDLTNWSPVQNPLPKLPKWSTFGYTWAPSVLPVGSSYLMYYTARDASAGRQCISIAVASNPAGPFTDNSKRPFICQMGLGGSIDPSPFVDASGVKYLIWKSDNNAIGQPTILWGQRLSTDGRSLVGSATRLLSADASWQAGVIEGPAMVSSGGRYDLFYGANAWDSANSAIGYGTCSTPLGPCTDVTTTAPWMSTHGTAVGPQGPAFFAANGAPQIAYDAWYGAVGYQNGGVRALWVDPFAAP